MTDDFEENYIIRLDEMQEVYYWKMCFNQTAKRQTYLK